MAIPEYCDQRAKKYFTSCFVGKTHGDNGSSNRMSWSSTSGAKPTATHKLNSDAHYCAYCGNKAFPIQDNIERHGDYTTTGWCCICKDAMDEVEWQAEYIALLGRQNKERYDMMQKAPKPTVEARQKVIRLRFDKIEDDIARDFFSESALKALSITLGHPKDHFKKEH